MKRRRKGQNWGGGEIGNKREKQGLDRILDPLANGASLSN